MTGSRPRSYTIPVSLFLILLIAFPLVPPSRVPAAQEDTEVPLPYDREEFPDWAWDLRRGEIIALGAFPVAMIISGIGLQLGRFAIKSVEEGQFSQEYAPFFLSTRTGPRYEQNERAGLLVSAGIISIGVALADYILGRREQRRSADETRR